MSKKQKAIRLETTDCDVYNRNDHVRLVGGDMDGWQMHIEVARQEYGLELNIDETKLYQITNGKLTLLEI